MAPLKRDLKALEIPQDANGYPTDEIMAYFGIPRRPRSGNVPAPPGPAAPGPVAPDPVASGSFASGFPAPGAPITAPVPPQNGLIQFPKDKENYIDVSMSDTPDVDGQPQPPAEEPSGAAEGDGRILYTSGMITCTGIAIRGIYPAQDGVDPSVPRYNRWLIHVAEENWWHHFDKLRTRVTYPCRRDVARNIVIRPS